MWHQNYTFQFFKSNRQECSELQNVRYYRAYIYLFIKRSHLYLRNVFHGFSSPVSAKNYSCLADLLYRRYLIILSTWCEKTLHLHSAKLSASSLTSLSIIYVIVHNVF